MKVLTFDDLPKSGRRVRDARFRERSLLPVSAACLVASGIRETLASIVSAPVTARLLEPVIPTSHAWSAITRDAAIYRFAGSIADAAIVLRPADAAAIAAAIFGERTPEPLPMRPLSPIERDVLDRAVAHIAGTLNAVCGAHDRESFERVHTIGGFAAYFEVAFEQAVQARIGIALSRDPSPEPHGTLDIGDLASVVLSPVVSVDLAALSAVALARVTLGAIVPLASPYEVQGRLTLEGRTLARGTCGAQRGRRAFVVESLGNL